MEWVRDVSVGDWLGEGGVHAAQAVVARGFPAYARILHPVFRERPVGVTWPEPGDDVAWARFGGEYEVDAELVSWATAAAALGAELGTDVTWERISGAALAADLRDADGWRYQDPDEGLLEPGALAAVVSVLAGYTSTPDEGYASIWDGWSGLVGGRTVASGVPSGYSGDGTPRHAAVLRRSFKDAINAPFRKASWQPGVLSDEISQGPRLQVSGHSHVLFRAAPRVWADGSWPSVVPWREPAAPWIHSPSFVWPDDRAWVIVTDPNRDSTLVGGDVEAIAALVAADGAEVYRIDPVR